MPPLSVFLATGLQIRFIHRFEFARLKEVITKALQSVVTATLLLH